ncbi:MAG TPA: hypothetical protein VN787_01760 [Steroidobacteraceae bacterium]|nr:hypothetical protein [Steroidobacteraceae bacterium]
MVESANRVREAPDGPYAARAILDQSALASIGEANRLFLDLVADRHAAEPARGAFGLAPETVARIEALAAPARIAVALCPYTLFDLRFKDAAFWRRLAGDAARRTPGTATDDACFARTAVFLAWHLAQSKDLAAALVLGMTAEVKCAWRGIPLSAIDHVAMAALPQAQARWGRHATFWPRLIDTAVPAAADRAVAVRLLGLQLLAADGLRLRVPRPAGSLTGA